MYNLVSENKRAWHAGSSYWSGYTDLNSLSLGIELDFSDNKKNNKFSQKMLKSLIILIGKLKKKYKIKDENILGHSDIAPYRKKDPGSKFPWNIINNQNKLLTTKKSKNLHIELQKWFIKNELISKKSKAIFILGYLGYNSKQTLTNQYSLKKLLYAYQSHFIQNNITGKIDNITLNFMYNHFLKKFIDEKFKKSIN